MARKPRTDLADALHHVSARANGDELLFREPEDRREFLQDLRNVGRGHEWRCQAYCLMSTHFHLIVHTPKPTLSAGMARLCTSYAQWFNWKYDRHGHLFGGRFSSQHITKETHVFEAHRYVALNPVRAEHCDNPADWRWGSYRGLAGLERPADFLDVDAVYALFGPQADAPATYREFVLSGLERLGQTPPGSDPSGLAGVDEAAERFGHAADGLLVALLREPQAVAVFAVGLDDPVDVLPRLPVRIRRLRHV